MCVCVCVCVIIYLFINLPLTEYDETARIQFADQLMFTLTKRTKPDTKQMDSETYFSSDSSYGEFSNGIPIVGNTIQPF